MTKQKNLKFPYIHFPETFLFQLYKAVLVIILANHNNWLYKVGIPTILRR